MAQNPLKPIRDRSWDFIKARHLADRAGFGASPSAIERLRSLPVDRAVSDFVDFERYPESGDAPDWLIRSSELQQQRKELQREMKSIPAAGMDEQERADFREKQRKKIQEFRRERVKDIARLKFWWISRMRDSARPLQEKMALFWHGHFATSAEKVKSPFANYQLNELFRNAAVGNFKLLTYQVGCSPAMMIYLDNLRSRKEHPNENWARELMELYTIGQGHYTEHDIKEAARAFTGWTTDGDTFIYRARLHDDGAKVFMGERGNLNGNDIFDILFHRPEVAEFICEKIWSFFAYADPEPEIVAGLAETLRRHGYDLRPMLRQLFLSEAFYSERAIGTQIKSPAQLVVSMARQLDVRWDPLVVGYLLHSLRRMGQDLFFPPNVKGWPGDRAWIDAGTLMVRYNLSNFVVNGVASDPSPYFRRQYREILKDQMGKQGFKQWMRANNRASRKVQKERRMAAEAGMESGMDSGMAGQDLDPEPVSMRLPYFPYDAERFFARFEGRSFTEMSGTLSSEFTSAPMHGGQVAAIAELLSGEANPEDSIDRDNWRAESFRAAIHLMMSSAEYQLC